jgi:hypothetical protein
MYNYKQLQTEQRSIIATQKPTLTLGCRAQRSLVAMLSLPRRSALARKIMWCAARDLHRQGCCQEFNDIAGAGAHAIIAHHFSQRVE